MTLATTLPFDVLDGGENWNHLECFVRTTVSLTPTISLPFTYDL